MSVTPWPRAGHPARGQGGRVERLAGARHPGAGGRPAAPAAASVSAGQSRSSAAVPSASSPLQWRTRSQPAAMRRAGQGAGLARSAFMQRSSTDQHAVEADRAADHLADDRAARASRAGRRPAPRRRYGRSSPRRRCPARAAKGAQSSASSSLVPATRGRSRWLSTSGAAMAGNMLHHRDAAGQLQAFGPGAAEPGDLFRPVAEGAVADDVMRAGQAQVQHRGADDVEAGLRGTSAHAAPHWPRAAAFGGSVPKRGGGREWPASAAARSRATRPPSWSTRIGRRLAQQVADARRSAPRAGPGRRCCGRTG